MLTFCSPLLICVLLQASSIVTQERAADLFDDPYLFLGSRTAEAVRRLADSAHTFAAQTGEPAGVCLTLSLSLPPSP